MFSRNITVFILPLLLMGFIFYGGYYFLQEANQMTNEEISQYVTLDIDVNAIEETYEIRGTWNWNEVPQDGIIGEDYIGISVINENGDYITSGFNDGFLQLVNHGEVIFETKGRIGENGYIFSFPNQFLDQKVYGNNGYFSVFFESDSAEEYQFITSYLHTWEEHQGLVNLDSRFLSPQFKNPINDNAYWVIERFSEGTTER